MNDSPHPKERNELAAFEKAMDYKYVLDHELVRSCIENSRPAWEEFFRRFIPHIKRGIQGILVAYSLDNDQDVLWDIHERIVVKLIKKGVLSQCTNPSGIRAWLKTVAQNQTRDWVTEQGRKKRLPQRESENSTISLSAPIKGYEGITIEDTLKYQTGTSEITDELRVDLEKVLNTLSGIEDDKKMWCFRLSIISRLPLSPTEIDKLSVFSGCPVSEIRSRLTTMMQQVDKKEEKRIGELGTAVLLWHEIRRLETILAERSKDSSETSRNDIEELQRKIEDKSKRREDLLRTGNGLCRPANRDIGELIGLPDAKVNQVSNLIIRARSTLQRGVGGRDR